ncbi:hypothetical protein TNCT1_32750 [Streptomyces sp. 1-11]|nr:hypothetical protein TNCT1_32750 [Streptomyces sp. 1-11]
MGERIWKRASPEETVGTVARVAASAVAAPVWATIVPAAVTRATAPPTSRRADLSRRLVPMAGMRNSVLLSTG